ncbi:hypothetical protein [Sphingomonas sp.]
MLHHMMMVMALWQGGTTSDRQSAPLIDAIDACRTISEDQSRLACFDRTSAALIEAKSRKEIVVLDSEDVREARRSVFGFSLPNIRLFGSKERDAAAEVREIDSTVAAVRDLPGSFLRLSLADKSVWQTTESAMTLSIRAGDAIRIEAGMLGSYKATVNKRVIKVRRIA